MQTLIYEYGCRLHPDCMTDVNRQFWLARRQYNDCVAVIRARRAEGEQVLRAASAEYATLCDRAEVMAEAYRAAHRDNDEIERKRIRALEKPLWEERKTVRRAAMKICADTVGPIYNAIRPEVDAITAAAKAEGLYFETAEVTATSALRAWEKVRSSGGQVNFRQESLRYTDHLDIRFKEAGGVPVESLLHGEQSIIGLNEPGGSARYPGFRFRLMRGVNAIGTWQPHRQFPEEARVTTARLVKKRIGPDLRWYLQFQLSVPEKHVPEVEGINAKRQAVAALHLGWSMDDEGYRYIGALASHGGKHHERMTIPAEIPEALDRASALLSDRKKRRDTFCADHLPTMDDAGWTEAAQEHYRALRQLEPHQVAPRRLARLNGMLRDEGVRWPELDEFCRVDHWLWRAERHIADRARKRRLWVYRQMALSLVRRYGGLVIGMPNLLAAAKRVKDDGERNKLEQQARTARTVAALYEFRQCLQWAADRAGTIIVDAPDMRYGKTCATCGGTVERDTGLASCAHCHTSTDEKINAAKVLLSAWPDKAFADAAAQVVADRQQDAIEAAEKKAKRLKAMQDGLRKKRDERNATKPDNQPTAQ